MGSDCNGWPASKAFFLLLCSFYSIDAYRKNALALFPEEHPEDEGE
jgi:hypothetical protein